MWMTDIDRARGEAEAAALGERARFFEHDVRSEARWAEAVAAAVGAFGRLDGLVNNAGVGVQKSVEDTTLDEWRFVQSVNVEGVFLGCKHAIPAMRKGGGGSIVNVSSVAGLVGAADLPAYCASKGAVRLLSKSVALHCAQRGDNIRCNSVHPSFLETAMVQKMIDGASDPARARVALSKASALGRLGEADDAAWMIVYLISDESRFVTGSEMVVDGGTTARLAPGAAPRARACGEGQRCPPLERYIFVGDLVSGGLVQPRTTP